MAITLNVNGKVRSLDVDENTPLLWVLRDTLGLMGTKFGCGSGLCGACTVHLDGEPVRSCSTPIAMIEDQAITTIEGIGKNEIGKRVQDAWVDVDVAQCGYCQAGQIMAATALLTSNAKPSDEDIDSFMSGNICRCATYNRIRSAIKVAAGTATKEEG